MKASLLTMMMSGILVSIYVPNFSESNAWDFQLVMTRIFKNVPVTSKVMFPVIFQGLPNFFENVQSFFPTTFEHFQSY